MQKKHPFSFKKVFFMKRESFLLYRQPFIPHEDSCNEDVHQ